MIKENSKKHYEIWSNNLTKVYSDGKDKFEAVSKINLRIQPGIHGYLGPNGAGKTTTINMLIGAIAITEGEAKIRDKKAGTVKARQLIGFLPQDPKFYDEMTGEEYLIYTGQLGGLSYIEAKKKAHELLDYFDLFNERHREIGNYSGGMKQKIGIASALIHEPKVLILDEPTANLDPIGRADVINKIKDLSKEMSVFVSSHILSEIEQMCEEVTMINRGEIVVSDTITNIKKKFVSNMFILNTNDNELALAHLKEQEFVESVLFSEVDNMLHVTPKDPEELKKFIPKLILENNLVLQSFNQPQMSLQDIFMEIMAIKEEEDEI
jgi:ABC-2 type transport system ATP-binding protein